MLKAKLIIEALVRGIGKIISWLNAVLIVLICMDVLQRYMFNRSYNWIIELEWHIFGLVFLLGSAYTLQEDKHVRVDVYYQKFSERGKAIVNLLGTIFLLIPWCLVGIKTCINYASNSFYIREGSPNPGGLPALYLIKWCFVVCFVLLVLQGLAMIYNNIKACRR